MNRQGSCELCPFYGNDCISNLYILVHL
jgi:hypothetical protein